MNHTLNFADHLEEPKVRHQHGHRRLVNWELDSFITCRHNAHYTPSHRWNPHMSEEDEDNSGVHAVEAIYWFKSQSKWAYKIDCRKRRQQGRKQNRMNKRVEREFHPDQE